MTLAQVPRTHSSLATNYQQAAEEGLGFLLADTSRRAWIRCRTPFFPGQCRAPWRLHPRPPAYTLPLPHSLHKSEFKSTHCAEECCCGRLEVAVPSQLLLCWGSKVQPSLSFCVWGVPGEDKGFFDKPGQLELNRTREGCWEQSQKGHFAS